MTASLTPERRSEIWLSNITTSDCGIIAIQAITGLSRKRAEKLAVEYGYEPGVGMSRGETEQALRSLGHEVRPFSLIESPTPATFTLAHEYGSFLIYTDNHVMALVEGDLYNSKSSWHELVESVTEVLPTRKAKRQ